MPSIFLSPSTQQFNPYVTTGNEEFWMNAIADVMEPQLRASAINYVRNDPLGTAATAVRASNAGDYDFHLALHSNAAPESLAGKLRGIDAYYFTGSGDGERMADILVQELKEIYPLPDKVQTRPTTDLGEVSKTVAPSVLVEIGYHDNIDDANWVTENVEPIAVQLTQAVTDYFSLPYLPPMEERPAISAVDSGFLNLRNGPSTTFSTITKIPKDAPVTVLNEYKGWYVIEYDDLVGYVDKRFITLL